MIDPMVTCNGCDAAPADPASPAGYCTGCEAAARPGERTLLDLGIDREYVHILVHRDVVADVRHVIDVLDGTSDCSDHAEHTAALRDMIDPLPEADTNGIIPFAEPMSESNVRLVVARPGRLG